MILTGKKVLITGGTGSLGRATLHRARQENWNSEFVIYSRSEEKQSKLRLQFPNAHYILGDIRDQEHLQLALRDVDVVLHYAAYKQIPAAQVNVDEVVKTNVIGSKNVALAALNAGVERVVAASTDKACSPVTAYGYSKALMESLFQEYNTWGDTIFTLARYGNVVCSAASVIPLFLKQKAAGGPLTITDARMTRFWISLSYAVDLILEALQQPAGYVVVPKAPAMKVIDIAKAMGEGLPIKTIGMRAGEKIHEAMVNLSESSRTLMDNEFFYIPPPDYPVVHNELWEYTSDAPSYWLTWLEMEQMIQIAKELGS